MSAVEFTEREYAVLRGLASGLSCDQIASRMRRNRMTIYRDIAAMRDKVGAECAEQLVDRAWRLGLLTAETPLLPHEKPMPSDPAVVVCRKPRTVAAV